MSSISRSRKGRKMLKLASKNKVDDIFLNLTEFIKASSVIQGEESSITPIKNKFESKGYLDEDKAAEIIQSTFKMLRQSKIFGLVKSIFYKGHTSLCYLYKTLNTVPSYEGKKKVSCKIICIYNFYRGFITYKTEIKSKMDTTSKEGEDSGIMIGRYLYGMVTKKHKFKTLSCDLKVSELQIKTKLDFMLKFYEYEKKATKTAMLYAKSLMIHDGKLEFDAGKKLDGIMEEILEFEFLDLEDMETTTEITNQKLL